MCVCVCVWLCRVQPVSSANESLISLFLRSLLPSFNLQVTHQTHTHTLTYMHIHTHSHIDTHTHTHTYTLTHTHTHIHSHTHIHIHIHTHTHTATGSFQNPYQDVLPNRIDTDCKDSINPGKEV